MERDKDGFYILPKRPPGLPEEEDYPRRYTVKQFTTEEVNENRYYNSIRGRNISRMVKVNDIPRIVDGKKEILTGYVPEYSNLYFRAMNLGIVKVNDLWYIVERQTGINLMPFETSAQLSLIPTKIIQGAKTREQAIEISEKHVQTFSDEQWIEIQKQITYELSGISFEYVLTPEQKELEAEWGERFEQVWNLNEWIRKEQNFINHHKGLRVHKTHTKRLKMVTRENGIRVPEKLDPRHKTKFFCFQRDYSSNLEIEGIIMPLEIEGLTEMRELVVVKGEQFKGTPQEKSYSAGEYIICEPYSGGLMSYKSAKSLKETLANITERLMILITPENIEKINKFIQLHNEKIETLQSGGDITKFLLSEYASNNQSEQQAA